MQPRVPEYLKEKLAGQYGRELTEKILTGYENEKPVTLRVNTLKTDREIVRKCLELEGIGYKEVLWSRDAYIIEGVREAAIEGFEIYKTGKIYLRVLQVQDHVRLTVQDEGMGIPAESIPHIFDRFYRTDQSRDRKTGGTGLGLSIARWIVERHDGWFEVVSRQDVGTRITVVLPAALGERIDNTAAHKL